ncbi:XK-related protein [Caligus rogercresseyi]|uniref:XK-related protein n=1 Tax=Caligus rogercresseyi TaxID=217165 RepID=A0A7T8QV98_CALRO|nr:XK-related protein [Caligus rogercresseyi]
MFDHLNTRLGSNEDFLAYFKHIEFRSQSILFVCAQHKLHGLLAQMIKCFEDRGLEKELSQFLVEQTPVMMGDPSSQPRE